MSANWTPGCHFLEPGRVGDQLTFVGPNFLPVADRRGRSVGFWKSESTMLNPSLAGLPLFCSLERAADQSREITWKEGEQILSPDQSRLLKVFCDPPTSGPLHHQSQGKKTRTQTDEERGVWGSGSGATFRRQLSSLLAETKLSTKLALSLTKLVRRRMALIIGGLCESLL
jgi:hypothetical protein